MAARVVTGLGWLGASPADAPPAWVTYFLAEDCDVSTAKTATLGATIVRQPFGISAARMPSLIGAQGELFSLFHAPPKE